MNAPPAPADYLGRLAARALGQTPPLALRLASPFEGPAGLAAESGEDGPAVLVDSPQPALAVPMDFPSAVSPRSALAGFPDSPPRRAEDRVPETPAPKERNLNSLGLQPQVHDPQDTARPEGAVPFLESLPSLSDLAPISPARSVTPSRGLGEEGGPRLGLKPQAQIPLLQGGAWQGKIWPTEPIDEISASSLAPRAALEGESLALSTLNLPAPRADHRALPPAEPVVRVTIGRIEVRAVAPASPPPPAARPAAPRLGLAEYLRRRGEGRP